MNQQGWIVKLFFPAFLLSFATANAQLPNSDFQMISPAFAKAGSTVEVTVSGTNLEELTSLRFNDVRIKGEPVMLPKDEIYPDGKQVANKFTVKIPPGVKPGIVEARTQGYFGLSTARPFMILPADATEIPEEGDHSTQDKAMPLAIETGVSGTLDSRGTDWYKVAAEKGEQLMIQVWAERLDSKADAQLSIFNSSGQELETNRLHFVRDPFIDFTAPEDGDYFIAVSEILYRGGSQYFYRLKVSKVPIIDFVWPPAGVPGTKTKFTIFGRNLPGGSLGEGVELDGKALESVEVEIDVPPIATVSKRFSASTPRQATLPGFEHQIGNSNALKIGFATTPVIFEVPDSISQTVQAPCEIAAKFDVKGDSDTFRFSAKKDTTYFIESISDRMKVNSDTVLILRKVGDDKIVAENDDTPSFFSADRFDSTNLDTTDAMLNFTADADSEYEVTVINQAGGGSAAHLYRLAIREAQHDFQLFTTTERTITATNGRAGFPAAPIIRKNGTIVYRVVAPRQDGFEGDIVVRASGLPEGVSAPPLTLSGDSTTGFLVIKAAANAAAWSGPITISGRATIGENNIRRVAQNASLVWGVIFSDSFRVRSRLDLEIVLSVISEESTPTTLTSIDPNKVWEVELNQKLEIPIKTTEFNALRKGNLTVQPHGFPGMQKSPPTVAIAETATDGKLVIDFKPNGNFAAKPGDFQFALQGTGLAKYQHNPKLGLAATKEHKRLEALEKIIVERIQVGNKRVIELERSSATEVELAAAKKAVEADKALLKRVTVARGAADTAAKAARAKAVAKDTKFVTYSTPVSVKVNPVPAKEAVKK